MESHDNPNHEERGYIKDEAVLILISVVLYENMVTELNVSFFQQLLHVFVLRAHLLIRGLLLLRRKELCAGKSKKKKRFPPRKATINIRPLI